MSIRKALGASVMSIARMFTSEIMLLLLVATIIAVPIAWFLMSRFLQNYSYHTKLSLWIFVASALLTMGVALLTISYQTVRILLTNPAESLKTE